MLAISSWVIMRRNFYKIRNIPKKSEKKNLEAHTFSCFQRSQDFPKMLTTYNLKAPQEKCWEQMDNSYSVLPVAKKNSVTSFRWLFKILYIGNSFEQITRPNNYKLLGHYLSNQMMLNHLLNYLMWQSSHEDCPNQQDGKGYSSMHAWFLWAKQSHISCKLQHIKDQR